ncbi:hypothetical protein [Burkholderia sp. BDU5]|nr:hypothetical protein [Burkholderia sp. BDU5]
MLDIASPTPTPTPNDAITSPGVKHSSAFRNLNDLLFAPHDRAS